MDSELRNIFINDSTLNFTDTHAQPFIVFQTLSCTILEGLVAHMPGNKFSEFVHSFDRKENTEKYPTLKILKM